MLPTLLILPHLTLYWARYVSSCCMNRSPPIGANATHGCRKCIILTYRYRAYEKTRGLAVTDVALKFETKQYRDWRNGGLFTATSGRRLSKIVSFILYLPQQSLSTLSRHITTVFHGEILQFFIKLFCFVLNGLLLKKNPYFKTLHRQFFFSSTCFTPSFGFPSNSHSTSVENRWSRPVAFNLAHPYAHPVRAPRGYVKTFYGINKIEKIYIIWYNILDLIS